MGVKMKYTSIYNLCIMVSCIFEIYFAIYFYKGFHNIRNFFKPSIKIYIFYICFVLAKIMVNMQHNNKFNLLFSIVQYLAIIIILFTGNLWLKIINGTILTFISAVSEIIMYLLIRLLASVPKDQEFENSFFMVSVMFSSKMIYFILVSFVRQFSKYSNEKLDLKLFGNYIIVPFATYGIVFTIPYTRKDTSGYEVMDIILIIFFIIMLFGNVNLFYMFSKYNKIKEEQMLQEASRAKYAGEKRHYNKLENIDGKYKELLHNINHYLRQIGIYADNNQTDKIKQVLSDLQVEFVKCGKEIICTDIFLNSILSDFKKRVLKENIRIELFVEPGFKTAFIKESDLTVIIGNLFDNALEAAKKCKDGKINVKFFMQNQGMLSVIYIENNYNGLIYENEDGLVSTKKEQGVHGIGIKSVQNITRKYNGYMQQEHSGNTFKTTIIMPIQLKT